MKQDFITRLSRILKELGINTSEVVEINYSLIASRLKIKFIDGHEASFKVESPATKHKQKP